MKIIEKRVLVMALALSLLNVTGVFARGIQARNYEEGVSSALVVPAIADAEGHLVAIKGADPVRPDQNGNFEITLPEGIDLDDQQIYVVAQPEAGETGTQQCAPVDAMTGHVDMDPALTAISNIIIRLAVEGGLAPSDLDPQEVQEFKETMEEAISQVPWSDTTDKTLLRLKDALSLRPDRFIDVVEQINIPDEYKLKVAVNIGDAAVPEARNLLEDDLPELEKASSSSITPALIDADQVPEGFEISEIVDAGSLPPGSLVGEIPEAAFTLPFGFRLNPDIEYEGKIFVSAGITVPADVKLSADTELSPGVVLEEGLTLPENIELPPGLIIPPGMDLYYAYFQEKFTPPEDFEPPPGFAFFEDAAEGGFYFGMPAGFKFPFEPPEEIVQLPRPTDLQYEDYYYEEEAYYHDDAEDEYTIEAPPLPSDVDFTNMQNFALGTFNPADHGYIPPEGYEAMRLADSWEDIEKVIADGYDPFFGEYSLDEMKAFYDYHQIDEFQEEYGDQIRDNRMEYLENKHRDSSLSPEESNKLWEDYLEREYGLPYEEALAQVELIGNNVEPLEGVPEGARAEWYLQQQQLYNEKYGISESWDVEPGHEFSLPTDIDAVLENYASPQAELGGNVDQESWTNFISDLATGDLTTALQNIDNSEYMGIPDFIPGQYTEEWLNYFNPELAATNEQPAVVEEVIPPAGEEVPVPEPALPTLEQIQAMTPEAQEALQQTMTQEQMDAIANQAGVPLQEPAPEPVIIEPVIEPVVEAAPVTQPAPVLVEPVTQPAPVSVEPVTQPAPVLEAAPVAVAPEAQFAKLPSRFLKAKFAKSPTSLALRAQKGLVNKLAVPIAVRSKKSKLRVSGDKSVYLVGSKIRKSPKGVTLPIIIDPSVPQSNSKVNIAVDGQVKTVSIESTTSNSTEVLARLEGNNIICDWASTNPALKGYLLAPGTGLKKIKKAIPIRGKSLGNEVAFKKPQKLKDGIYTVVVDDGGYHYHAKLIVGELKQTIIKGSLRAPGGKL